MQLCPPCTYQGGKQRIASQIVAQILTSSYNQDTQFYDFCCGSGAISLALINAGIKSTNIHMVDSGGFGWFWQTLAQGKFNLNLFQEEIEKLPPIDQIQAYLTTLSKYPIDTCLGVYHYLLLQSGCFGGKQIGIQGEKWTNTSFRSYWLPTPTSNRRSPVNPMMPMPKTLLQRVEDLHSYFSTHSIQASYMSINDYLLTHTIPKNSILYVDPPYMGTTGYQNTFDYETFLSSYIGKYPIYISEGIPLSNAQTYLISKGRKKGNISSAITKPYTCEYLNYFYL